MINVYVTTEIQARVLAEDSEARGVLMNDL